MDQQIEQTQAEQTEAQDIQADDFGGPSRDDLIAAVRDAGGTESVDLEAEAAAAGTAPPAKVEPTTEPEEPKIAAVLRAREKAFQERQEAESYAEQRKRQADEEANKILAEAKKRAEEEWANEIAAKRRRFEESPTEAIRSLGKNPDDIVNAVVREGTPEWQEFRRIQQELDAAKAKAGDVDKVKEELAAFRKAQEDEKWQATVHQIRTQFLTEHASAEKVPSLYQEAKTAAALLETTPEDIVFDRANRLAQQWQKSGLKLGVDFDRNDVAAYLEHQSKQRLGAAGTAPQQVSGASGNAPKVKANGSRTLSAATGSERRTSPKPLHEMTADEEREALIDEARKARAAYKPDA